jgi:hypothetical protein
MKGKNKKRVSLSVSRETKAMLDTVKHTGQSYNGLLQELVTFWKEQLKQKTAAEWTKDLRRLESTTSRSGNDLRP